MIDRFVVRSLAPMLVLVAAALPTAHGQDAPQGEGRVRVATLVYGGGKTSICFAPGFLDAVAYETGINIQRTLGSVELASEELFNYPFVIMTGEGAFTLSDAEKARLKEYVERGGFLLASAGCSNAQWIDSFQAAMTDVFGEAALEPIDLEHPIFHTLYDIHNVQLKKVAEAPAIFGLTYKGRLHVVYSPMGLNDTGNAAEGCCCCGGNEVRNAKLINANILTYALTH